VSQTTKNFESLHDAYTFFQEHSTEAEQDRLGYLSHLVPLARSGRPIRLLDFGSGDGGFLTAVLDRAGFDPQKLTLSLVEPDAGYRRQAVASLQAFTERPIRAWPELPTEEDGPFDVVLANHVLYYVIDLADTVARIRRVLADDGIFLTTMGDHGNAFSQWSDQVYAALHVTPPHYLAPDLETILTDAGQPFEKTTITYDLGFPDSAANRILLLRFMLGQNFDRLPPNQLLALLDPHTADGRVAVRTYHYQLAIRK